VIVTAVFHSGAPRREVCTCICPFHPYAQSLAHTALSHVTDGGYFPCAHPNARNERSVSRTC
jgi:hypothetical protein